MEFLWTVECIMIDELAIDCLHIYLERVALSWVEGYLEITHFTHEVLHTVRCSTNHLTHKLTPASLGIVTLIARFMGPTWGHLGPTVPRWAPCWLHEPCYLACTLATTREFVVWIVILMMIWWFCYRHISFFIPSFVIPSYFILIQNNRVKTDQASVKKWFG